MDPSVKCDSGASFEDGILAFYPRLFPLALRLCRNKADAHDLVQDTVERGLRCRGLFRTGDTPDRWMSTILRRIFVDGCRSRLRRAGGAAIDEEAAWTEPASEPEEPPPWQTFSEDDVRRALLFVDAPSRETFSLFTFAKLDQAEIAKRLSISRHTVATRVFRTRAKLRAILASGKHQRPLAIVPPVAPALTASLEPVVEPDRPVLAKPRFESTVAAEPRQRRSA